jgi:hypothetical protein
VTVLRGICKSPIPAERHNTERRERMNVVSNEVKALVDKELEAAQGAHGLFASYHEKYAVMLEEAEEAEAELKQLMTEMERMWDAIKHDDSENADRFAARIRFTAERLACEAIQVAAMAAKPVKRKEDA